MGQAIFERANAQFADQWSRWRVPAHDSGTHISIEADATPNARTDDWDGATGIRVATQQELDDFDAAKLDRESTSQVNTPINKTLLDLLLDLETRLRRAGQPSDLPLILAATNAAEYKAALKEILESHS